MKALFILRVELLLSPNNPGPPHDSGIGATLRTLYFPNWNVFNRFVTHFNDLLVYYLYWFESALKDLDYD